MLGSQARGASAAPHPPIEGPPTMATLTEAARAATLPDARLGAQARHLARAIAAAIARWRTERALAHLDAHMLRDIGMEGTRPFERPLPTDRPELWR
jgi:hypothetical protein